MTVQSVAPPPSAIETFAAQLRGPLLRPADPGYDEARHVWNGMIDKRPALIARCAGAADVIAAVTFAREHDVPLSVRAGGHSAAGTAVADRGLMLDVSTMKGIRVDPARRTARAEAGLTWGEFDRETQAFGLATTGGVMSTTGIPGLTLGGGVGWLMRSYGLSCDNLLSVDIVTADGQLRTASSDDEPDLFWAARGGGGNFGVATSFEYRLHPVGPMVLGGLLIWPRSQALDVFRRYRDFTQTAPETASAYAALGTSPDGEPVVLVISFCHAPVASGGRLAAAAHLRIADGGLVQPMPYTALQQLTDPLQPAGNRVYWKSAVLQQLDDAAFEAMLEHTARIPSPLSAAVLEFYGGATNRVAVEATAYPHRQVEYALNAIGIWTDPAQDESNIGWSRGLWETMAPFSNGSVYVNFLGVGDQGEDRVRAAYGPNYDRLARIKATYDPTNLFRLNQNIRPLANPDERRRNGA